jgi:PadR family transcriptional regulator AphA
MAKANKTQYAVLGMLTISSMSGYEIRQTLQISVAAFWAESDGQIYPTLAKLTKQGYIKCKAKNSVREKKVYSITAKGMTELKKWLVLEADTKLVRDELLLKLFFGTHSSPETNLEHIRAHRYTTKARLSQLINKKELMQEQQNSPHFPYWQISIQYGIQVSEAVVKWCDDTIIRLEKLKLQR